MKDLLSALVSWTGRNCCTIKPQVSPVCRGDGGYLRACAEKKTVPLFIKALLWSRSVRLLPGSDHHSTTSLLALLPTADGVVKGDEWVLTLSGNRYPIVEDWVIVLSFHFALFPVELFFMATQGKSLPGWSLHTHTTDKHRGTSLSFEGDRRVSFTLHAGKLVNFFLATFT